MWELWSVVQAGLMDALRAGRVVAQVGWCGADGAGCEVAAVVRTQESGDAAGAHQVHSKVQIIGLSASGGRSTVASFVVGAQLKHAVIFPTARRGGLKRLFDL